MIVQKKKKTLRGNNIQENKTGGKLTMSPTVDECKGAEGKRCAGTKSKVKWEPIAQGVGRKPGDTQ